jgi:predicted nucleotidyltransferase
MITLENINTVVEKIITNYQPQKIILFGSYANGSPTKDSDLDLLIIKNSDTPKIERNRQVRRLLKDLYFPVDVFIKTEQEYNKYKDVIGTVVYSAHQYGKVLYGE